MPTSNVESMRVRVPLVPAVFRWSGVAAVAGVLFYVSVLTVPPETAVDTARPSVVPLDKWRHFLGYAGLGGALAYATADWKLEPRWAILLVVGTVVVYGIGIEGVQVFLPARHFSLGDAYANALGGLLVAPWFAIRPHLAFVSLQSWLSPNATTSRDA